ncbi:AAA family ATPase [Geodermatophilus sp. CPCC 206100]|uniref:AAA family ATPase n=1 Tax=Geodermatophilus sp. CPCC 206100 TaxID=3020054 RepID=UPI003AFF6F70
MPPSADDRPIELADLGKLARRGVRAVTRAARAGDQVTLAALLAAHLGEAGVGGDVVEETWPAYEHVNVQAGLDAWLTGRSTELVGIVNFRHRPFGLAELVAMAGQPADPFGPRPGNAATVNLPCGPDGETRPCLRCAVHLVDDGGVRTALLVRAAEPETGIERVSVQALSTDPAAARAAVREIRAAADRENVFRGQVLSFAGEVFGPGQTLLQFHRRPRLESGQLVLAADTLAEIERQVVDVARHKERLLAAGQHLKRGLLLYGPPGVGKTHTVRYLVGRLPGTTVVQLTGGALHLIAEACSVARTLQPAMVVVEDVDLIAEDRGMHPGQHPLLFQLLNEMDGLAEDADVVFLLTTNRADLLEPALAARPGRVDQAVQLTLPDRDARRALFELYRGDLAMDVSGLDEVLDRTDGVTASFLKELIRRAALFAAERSPAGSGALSVSAADLASALDELLDTRNAMTRTLLGAAAQG